MAAKNPAPSLITDAIWWFWLEFQKIEPSVRLGGIYAPKYGYHDTRAHNPKSDYSVQLAADRMGPGDKAAAIDLTFPDAQRGDFKTIAKYSRRLLASGRDLKDERGNFLREFYGQVDSDATVEGWDFQFLRVVSSDSSHLWHIHISWLRKYVTSMQAMRALLSILRGESVAVWRKREAALIKATKKALAKRPTKPASVKPAAIPPRLGVQPVTTNPGPLPTTATTFVPVPAATVVEVPPPGVTITGPGAPSTVDVGLVAVPVEIGPVPPDAGMTTRPATDVQLPPYTAGPWAAALAWLRALFGIH